VRISGLRRFGCFSIELRPRPHYRLFYGLSSFYAETLSLRLSAGCRKHPPLCFCSGSHASVTLALAPARFGHHALITAGQLRPPTYESCLYRHAWRQTLEETLVCRARMKKIRSDVRRSRCASSVKNRLIVPICYGLKGLNLGAASPRQTDKYGQVLILERLTTMGVLTRYVALVMGLLSFFKSTKS